MLVEKKHCNVFLQKRKDMSKSFYLEVNSLEEEKREFSFTLLYNVNSRYKVAALTLLCVLLTLSRWAMVVLSAGRWDQN
jgi:hypothetical protein